MEKSLLVSCRRFVAIAGALLLATFAGPSASATQQCSGTLGTAQSFNTFIKDTVDFDMGSVGGRSAFGGFSRLANANFGTQVPPDASRLDLIVGQNLDFTSGSLQNGSGTYAGTATLSGVNSPNGTITQAPPPFSFATEFANLQVMSTSWATLPPNGTTAVVSGQLRLTGTDAAQNIFSVTAAQINNASGIDIKVPPGSTTLINISGTSLSNHGQLVKFWTGSGYDSAFDSVGTAATLRNATLFNAPDVTTIGFNNTNWEGSILAPQAATQIMVTGFYGTLIAKSFSPTTQNSNFYNYPFDGDCLPPSGDPVPPTWPGVVVIGVLSGLGLMLAQRHSRREHAQT